jgi:aspartokinase/homoserine dehydrogenase 1
MNTKKTYHIFKFGGKSTDLTEKVIKVLVYFIVEFSKKLPENHVLVIVLSAFGKGTNALEYLFNASMKIQQPSYIDPKDFAGGDVYEFFRRYAEILDKDNLSDFQMLWNELYIELNQVNYEDKNLYFIDKMKARILAKGEIISMALLSQYLKSEKITHDVLDAHRYIYTYGNFTNAVLDEEKTFPSVSKFLAQTSSNVILVQGFIARDNAGNNTTVFPRDGSDFTASIIAAVTGTPYFVLCKDQPGVYHPSNNKRYGIPIPYLNYSQAPGYVIGQKGGTLLSRETISFAKKHSEEIWIAHYENPTKTGTRIGPEAHI